MKLLLYLTVAIYCPNLWSQDTIRTVNMDSLEIYYSEYTEIGRERDSIYVSLEKKFQSHREKSEKLLISSGSSSCFSEGFDENELLEIEEKIKTVLLLLEKEWNELVNVYDSTSQKVESYYSNQVNRDLVHFMESKEISVIFEDLIIFDPKEIHIDMTETFIAFLRRNND